MTRSLAEEAADPKTTPQRMRELIQTDRSLYAAVACNPNVDEPLRQWLWVNGGRDVQEAMVKQYEDAVRAQEEGRGSKPKNAHTKSTKNSKDSKAKDSAAQAKGTATKKPAGAQKSAQSSSTKDKLAAERAEVERLIAEREKAEKDKAEKERIEKEKAAKEAAEAKELEAKRQEAERLAKERAEAERRANEEAARLEAARAEAERLAKERADEERRLADQRKAAAELASIQAEAQAFAAKGPVNSLNDDETESTVVVNRSSRPFTRLVTNGGQIFSLTEDVVILGRTPRGFFGSSVQVLNIKDTERTISKTHARLSWHDNAWYISDLGSTNGVSVGAGNSLVELDGDEEMKVEGPFSLGLHDMRLEIAQ